MKKALALFFLSLYLFSTTELSQLLKLPVLVVHYNEHKVQNPKMSFYDFIALHYSGHHSENHPRNHDYDQDQKLPFFNPINVLSVVCVSPSSSYFDFDNNHLFTKNKNFFEKQKDCFENNHLSSIWQPPKFC